MKVFKMRKLEILMSEIKHKIEFLEIQMMKSKKTDSQVLSKIPNYLDAISVLEKENAVLKADRKQAIEEHSTDLEKVEGLIDELAKLVEANDA